MSDPDDLPLAAEFPAVTRAQWLALVERVLKGARFETLRTETLDGLPIEPLYARTPASTPAARSRGRWQVMGRVDHPYPAAANAQALAELEGGANGLVLVFADSVGAYGYGLTANALPRVLDGVQLDAGISIEFDLSEPYTLSPLELTGLLKKRSLDPGTLDIRFGFDLIGQAALGGGPQLFSHALGFFHDPPDMSIGRFTAGLSSRGFTRSYAADGRVVHGAGGTEVHELGYVIAAALSYLRALEAGGIALDAARRMIFFRLAADADQFLTIAKFRALRKLWARIEESCGLAPEPAFISAETAWRTMTRNDPQVNILRGTIAAFAAGIGGADAITVLPFTAARGLPDAFARRIARNTQLILLDEANVARVADPTAGTGWNERLSDDLCLAAWVLFQEIEAAGGAAGALKQGLIQRKVAGACAERERAVATRTLKLVGANEFPDLAELPAAVLDVRSVEAPSMPLAIAFEPLSQTRLAEPYEKLRDASDRMLAATGSRPKIFLANLGRGADFNARANFAANFFAAGGIETMSNDGFASRAAMIAAFKASRARLACLCGSDAVYAREAADAAKALKAAGAGTLFLSGKPAEREADLRHAGVDTFIHVGCDALAILRSILKEP